MHARRLIRNYRYIGHMFVNITGNILEQLFIYVKREDSHGFAINTLFHGIVWEISITKPK